MLLYTLLAANVQIAVCISHQESLMRHLFETMNYYKDAPSNNSATLITVKTLINAVAAVDEKEQTVKIEMNPVLTWMDQRLQWNKSKCGGLSHFTCP